MLVSKEDGIYTCDFTSRQWASIAKNAGLVLRLLNDGQTVASTDEGFALKLWDLATGREIELPGRGGFHDRSQTSTCSQWPSALTARGRRSFKFRELMGQQHRALGRSAAAVAPRLPGKREVRWIKFSDDGNLLVACGPGDRDALERGIQSRA